MSTAAAIAAIAASNAAIAASNAARISANTAGNTPAGQEAPLWFVITMVTLLGGTLIGVLWLMCLMIIDWWRER